MLLKAEAPSADQVIPDMTGTVASNVGKKGVVKSRDAKRKRMMQECLAVVESIKSLLWQVSEDDLTEFQGKLKLLERTIVAAVPVDHIGLHHLLRNNRFQLNNKKVCNLVAIGSDCVEGGDGVDCVDVDCVDGGDRVDCIDAVDCVDGGDCVDNVDRRII